MTSSDTPDRVSQRGVREYNRRAPGVLLRVPSDGVGFSFQNERRGRDRASTTAGAGAGRPAESPRRRMTAPRRAKLRGQAACAGPRPSREENMRDDSSIPRGGGGRSAASPFPPAARINPGSTGIAEQAWGQSVAGSGQTVREVPDVRGQNPLCARFDESHPAPEGSRSKRSIMQAAPVLGGSGGVGLRLPQSDDPDVGDVTPGQRKGDCRAVRRPRGCPLRSIRIHGQLRRAPTRCRHEPQIQAAGPVRREDDLTPIR